MSIGINTYAGIHNKDTNNVYTYTPYIYNKHIIITYIHI